jgi:hypothetical protein
MKTLWLLSGGCLLAFASFGQGRDTVLAVHKLFRQQRPKGAELATAGAGSLIQNNGSVAGTLATVAVSGATSASVFFLQNRRYSVEREALILQAYAQGIPIPADIRRRLRGKFFKRTAQDINAGF